MTAEIQKNRAALTSFLQDIAKREGDKWRDLMAMGWVDLIAYLVKFADRYERDREQARLERLKHGR